MNNKDKKYYFKFKPDQQYAGWFLVIEPVGIMKPDDDTATGPMAMMLIESYTIEEFEDYARRHPKNKLFFSIGNYELIPEEAA